MFGLFKKKIKDVVDRLSGKIDKETKETTDIDDSKVPDKSVEMVADVSREESKQPKEKEHHKKDSVVGAETRRDELCHKEVERKTAVDHGRGKERTEAKKAEPEKESIFSKLAKPLTSKTLSEEFLDEVLWDIELVLLENNVAQEVSQKIITDIKSKLLNKSVRKSQAEQIIKDTMRESILEVLDLEKEDLDEKIKSAKKEGRCLLILFLGFNGSGKTTTMAKMGKYLLDKGYSCVFAAGDSFRAAAIEQLEVHANTLGIRLIKQKYGTDPSAVIFDAVKHANSKGINIVLADSAGRVHTDRNLVEELKKIVRVNKPDLKFLVIESIAGNDVVEQAKVFDETGLDGVILTKTDVDEKGGSALSLSYTLKKPIYFIGTGQKYTDFEEFDAKKMIKNIFD